ncbi:hypothetical protein EDC04DRAFT_2614047 [Pisolithus marmoratus]|nr:hypothetical protein EDC04DRAFT_2614047 [Pisolithus marmoratus]
MDEDSIISHHMPVRPPDVKWGEQLRLMNFIVQNRQELPAAYRLLTIAQKQAYNDAIMTAHAAKVPSAHSNPKSISQWMGLCAETGLEGFYIAVHGTVEDLSEPRVFSQKRQKTLCLESWVCPNINDHSISWSLTEFILTTNGIKGNSQINYTNYEKQIVEKLGVVLHGWLVPGHICNPSKVKQTELEKLLDALKEETCKWDPDHQHLWRMGDVNINEDHVKKAGHV